MSYFKTNYRAFTEGDFKLIEKSTDYTVTPSHPSIFTDILLDGYEGDDAVVFVPDNVTVVKTASIKNKENLTEIHFPKGVKDYSTAIIGCPSLEALHFHSTCSIHFSGGAFSGIKKPIKIYFDDTSALWLKYIEPWTETESSYDNGWGGGAPGLYTKEYLNTPMHHELGKDFYTEVVCLADGVTLTIYGENAPRKLVKSSTPYDT